MEYYQMIIRRFLNRLVTSGAVAKQEAIAIDLNMSFDRYNSIFSENPRTVAEHKDILAAESIMRKYDMAVWQAYLCALHNYEF